MFSDVNPFHPVKVKLDKFLHPSAIFAKTQVTSLTFQLADLVYKLQKQIQLQTLFKKNEEDQLTDVKFCALK